MKVGATHTVSRPAQSIDAQTLSAMAQSAYAERKMDIVLDLTSRLLAAQPENAVALKLRARVHAQRGESDLAEPIWRRLCAAGSEKVEPALSVARIAYARGDWDTMATFADLAVRESGKRADAIRLAITARVKARRADGLPALLLRLHALEPERFTAVLKTLSGPELAQAQASVLARLCASAPVDPALDSLIRDCRKSWEIGAVRAEAKKDDEVQAAYLRAIWTFDPGSREAIDRLNALSRERLKFLRMAIKHGADDVSLQQAEDAAKFNPTSFEAWFAIARLSAASNPRHSADCFRICAELNPGDAYYRLRQGLALTESDRPEEAIEALTTVVDVADDVADPIASAALATIAALSRTIFSRALEAVRVSRLHDARSLYDVATRSAHLGGSRLPTGARAMFWAGMTAAQIRVAVRSIGCSATKVWKRTKTRIARLRRRILGQAASFATRPGAARSTRG